MRTAKEYAKRYAKSIAGKGLISVFSAAYRSYMAGFRQAMRFSRAVKTRNKRKRKKSCR